MNKMLINFLEQVQQYSWGISQVEDFWNDIEEISEDDIHFLGSIVLITNSHNPGNFNALEVVDGQQRLTTILILLKAIQNKYKELNEDEMVENINEYLYSRVLRRGERIKLKLGRFDNDDFIQLMNENIDEIKHSNIYKSYKFFKSKLEGITNLDNLLHKIYYQINFVIIFTDSDKSAYRLFETLNDRGLELSAVDLIKNHLLKVISERDLDIEETKNSWEEIIENLNGIDKVRYFRQYLLSSKICIVKGKISKDGLYDKFCEVLDKVTNIQELIEDINKQSLLYSKLVNFRIDLFNDSRNEIVNRHLRNIGAIKATTSYTFLIKTFNDLNNAEDIIKLLKLVETFAIRRNIVGVSTADIDLIYNHLAIEAFKPEENCYEYTKKYFKKNMPSDVEFEEKFKNINLQQNDQTKYILDKIEVESYGAGNDGLFVANRFNVHIEHITPQKINDASKWGGFNNLSDEEKKDFITNIGNLTLLEKRPNIQAANSDFEEKKEYYNKNNTDFFMTHDLLNYDKWGVNEIKSRAEKLSKMAVEIWKI